MKEFFTAAFPWIVIGLCIAILAASVSRNRRKPKDGENGEKKENYMVEGMCIGMCVGMCCGTNLGFLGIDTAGTAMCIGMLVGEVVGMMIPKEKQQK